MSRSSHYKGIQRFMQSSHFFNSANLKTEFAHTWCLDRKMKRKTSLFTFSDGLSESFLGPSSSGQIVLVPLYQFRNIQFFPDRFCPDEFRLNNRDQVGGEPV